MKKRIVRWLIRWWIDDDRPSWLQHIVDRDADLQEYERGLQIMSDRLRNEAGEWSERIAASKIDRTDCENFSVLNRRTPSPRQPRLRPAVALAGGLALTLVCLGLARVHWNGSLDEAASKAATRSQQVKKVTDDDTFRAGADSLVVLYNASRRGLIRSVDGIPSMLQSAAHLTNYPSANVTQKARIPFESTSRAYGRAVALVNRSLSDQRKGLANNARSVLHSLKLRLHGLDQDKRADIQPGLEEIEK